jgi:hypothetical protein
MYVFRGTKRLHCTYNLIYNTWKCVCVFVTRAGIQTVALRRLVVWPASKQPTDLLRIYNKIYVVGLLKINSKQIGYI